jgi:hypothetical protein
MTVGRRGGGRGGRRRATAVAGCCAACLPVLRGISCCCWCGRACLPQAHELSIESHASYPCARPSTHPNAQPPPAVETRSNGHDALELLRERQEHNHPFDLVLSDVYMPDMDGFKLLECIGLELDLPVISKHPAPTCPAPTCPAGPAGLPCHRPVHATAGSIAAAWRMQQGRAGRAGHAGCRSAALTGRCLY